MFVHQLTDDAELRLIEPRHADELYSVVNRNRSRLLPRMSFVEDSTSADSERAFAKRGLHQFAEGQGFQAAIFYKGKIAGEIGMSPFDLMNRSTEFGYWLDKDAEGMGLATASARALIDYCFWRMNLNRVVIRTACDNTRSQAVAKRLGAKYEGRQRQSVCILGELIDQEVFSIIREDWPDASQKQGKPFFTHRLNDQMELEILEPKDAWELFQLIDRNRWYLRKWFPWVDGTLSEEDTRTFCRKELHELAENGTLVAGILYEGRIAGTIGLHVKNRYCREIGYWIGENFQGKGLVTTACKALIRYSFETLNTRRLVIRAEPDNKKSQAVTKRLGFTYEGTSRQVSKNSDAEFVDMMNFSLLKEEWAVRQ